MNLIQTGKGLTESRLSPAGEVIIGPEQRVFIPKPIAAMQKEDRFSFAISPPETNGICKAVNRADAVLAGFPQEVGTSHLHILFFVTQGNCTARCGEKPRATTDNERGKLV